MKTKTYTELVAWQIVMDLVQDIYTVTRGFPREELYGLAAQLRRAAVSLPSNIAEGQGRKSPREFLHFLSVAYGSLGELETQLLISVRLGSSSQTNFDRVSGLAGRVGRLINGLSNSRAN